MTLAGWTPRPVPGGRVLCGDRVQLEPLDWDVHGAGLFAAVAGPANAAIWAYMPIGPFDALPQFRSVFEAVCEQAGWQTLVIRRLRDGLIVGMASYMRIRPEHGSAEIGCVAFGDALKRTPEATEAGYLMAADLFDRLGYRRYEWKCHNDNAASRRAAARFGFRFEGVFRNDMVVRGKSRDTAWFAMTDVDWPAIRAGLQRWLAVDNFDAAGQQRRSLEAMRA